MKNPLANLFKKKGTEDAPSVTPEAPTKKKENFFQKLINLK